MPVSSQAADGHRTARHTQREPARWRQEVLESLLPGVLRHATSDQPDHATAATHTSRKYCRSKPFVFSLDPALPGAVRVAEIHRDVGVDGEPSVLGHLLTLIPGQRPAQMRRESQHRPGQGIPNRFGGVIGRQVQQHHVPQRHACSLRPHQLRFQIDIAELRTPDPVSTARRTRARLPWPAT